MNQVVKDRTERTKWYNSARFGMFIHWGLYAIPARGEWVRSVYEIPKEEYDPYFDEFTTENYNPKEWARLAKKAGMKYAVLTAKHHDGFCLFDTKLTDFNSVKAPCKRDLVKEFLEAFREEGIKVFIIPLLTGDMKTFHILVICIIQCAIMKNAVMKTETLTVIWSLCLDRLRNC